MRQISESEVADEKLVRTKARIDPILEAVLYPMEFSS
jgi:hypothetical protein